MVSTMRVRVRPGGAPAVDGWPDAVPDIRLERAAWTRQGDHVISLTPAGVICERSDGVSDAVSADAPWRMKQQPDMSGSSIYAILVCGSDRGGGRWCPDPLRHLRYGREVGCEHAS